MEEIKKEIIERNKAHWFVKHIQKHLDNGDTGCVPSKITNGKVGCTICGKDIDQIAEEFFEEILIKMREVK